MIYSGQSLYKWHINRSIIPNERLTVTNRQRMGHFIFHNNQWLLVNERMPKLVSVQTDFNQSVPIEQGQSIVLKEGLQLLFAKGEKGSRLAIVQIINV